MALVYLCILGLSTVLLTETDAQNGYTGDFMSGFRQGMDDLNRNLSQGMDDFRRDFRQGMNDFRRNMRHSQATLQNNLRNMKQRIREENKKRAAVLKNMGQQIREESQRRAAVLKKMGQQIREESQRQAAVLKKMGQQIREEKQRVIESYARGLKPGEGRYINDGKLRGYVYRGYGGQISYVLGSGFGNSVYISHIGPGWTVEWRW